MSKATRQRICFRKPPSFTSPPRPRQITSRKANDTFLRKRTPALLFSLRGIAVDGKQRRNGPSIPERICQAFFELNEWFEKSVV